ncbi:MAG: hypothetical protein II285_03420, partial [Flavobacteriales bacterium]|nr:hypothetical protein [Flavobacteriales bacterium]
MGHDIDNTGTNPLTGRRRVWKEYQKVIPSDKYFYVRSCIRQNIFPASEVHFLKIMREALGK